MTKFQSPHTNRVSKVNICETCSPEPNKMIPVENVYTPSCPNCGAKLLHLTITKITTATDF